jgi:pimeloyl-ACP methyl ester carboxylesterase
VKRALKIVAGIFSALLFVAAIAIGGALAWRLHRQGQIAPLLALDGPGAIRDQRYVMIGGVKQWIGIRGENRANPVILFVHGGPGASLFGVATIFRRWERDFTIVQWDQRGAGLTFAAGARLTPDVPMERMVDDGIEVTEYVRHKLGVQRVILVGHSWGSVLGVHMVKARPDLFSAYVGTGQLKDVASQIAMTYDNTLARARASRNDADIKKLEALGHPPYRSQDDLSTLLLTRNHYVNPSDAQFVGLGRGSELATIMTSPDLSLSGAIASVRGIMVTAGSLDIYPPLAHADLPALGCDFPIPFFIIEGDDDRFTYTQSAKSYYECVDASHKELLLIPGGHFAAMTNAETFHEALARHVRPFALASWDPALLSR